MTVLLTTALFGGCFAPTQVTRQAGVMPSELVRLEVIEALPAGPGCHLRLRTTEGDRICFKPGSSLRLWYDRANGTAWLKPVAIEVASGFMTLDLSEPVAVAGSPARTARRVRIALNSVYAAEVKSVEERSPPSGPPEITSGQALGVIVGGPLVIYRLSCIWCP